MRPGDDADPTDDELRGTLLARRLAKRRGYGLAGREPKVRRGLSTWTGEDGASPHRGLRTPLEALFWASLGALAIGTGVRRLIRARSK